MTLAPGAKSGHGEGVMTPITRHLLPRFFACLVCLGILALFAGSSRGQEQTAREFQDCSGCPMMVAIPAGSFAMGSPAQEAGRFDTEGPQHSVSIRAFALGKYDVTSQEFLLFLSETSYQPAPCNSILHLSWSVTSGKLAYPPLGTEPPRWPAVCLDWHDAEAYIAWLNAKAYAEHPTMSKDPYRLPSEAEWEYAARGGTMTARWWGDAIGSNKANCNGCGSPADNKVFSEVDSFAPNGFGLYGVLGNAWQWTADCWHPNYVDAPRDGSPWMTGDCSKRVIRGGSDRNFPIFIRSAAREAAKAGDTNDDYSGMTGFRVARNLP